jgi:hypothetical protein
MERPDIDARRLLVLRGEQREIGITRIERTGRQLRQTRLVQHQEGEETFSARRGRGVAIAMRNRPE